MGAEEYDTKSIKTKDPATTKVAHYIMVRLLRILTDFNIHYRTIKSQTSQSLYLIIWQDDRKKKLKVRISDH